MKKEYFVVRPTEDGAKIYNMDKNSLHEFIINLTEEWEFIKSLDNVGSDPNYWGNRILIMKGKSIVPNPVKVVTKFQIP